MLDAKHVLRADVLTAGVAHHLKNRPAELAKRHILAREGKRLRIQDKLRKPLPYYAAVPEDSRKVTPRRFKIKERLIDVKDESRQLRDDRSPSEVSNLSAVLDGGDQPVLKPGSKKIPRHLGCLRVRDRFDGRTDGSEGCAFNDHLQCLLLDGIDAAKTRRKSNSPDAKRHGRWESLHARRRFPL